MYLTWLNFKIVPQFLFLILVSYPILGGLAWFIGGLCYKYVFQNKRKKFAIIPPEKEPMITIMIPAHNEEVSLAETIHYLLTGLNGA